MSHSCYRCQAELTPNLFHRSDECPKCRFDTRVCKNCVHHDPAFNNSCKETQADRIVEKEKANFCDYFSPANRSAGTKDELSPAEKARIAAEALFGKKK